MTLEKVTPVHIITPEPFKLYKSHPVLAGFMVFRLNLEMNDLGITICNAWGSVNFPAHSYNALQHSAGLEEKWEDMDYVVRSTLRSVFLSVHLRRRPQTTTSASTSQQASVQQRSHALGDEERAHRSPDRKRDRED
jgi:hypothetical protein